MNSLFLSCLLSFIFLPKLYSQQPKNDGAVPQFPLVENKITYLAQIPVDSKDKARLFGNAENWYKKNFETADNTLTTDNTDDGTISGTGIIHEKKHDQKAGPGDVFFTVDIRAANGMYAYKVHDIYGFDKTGKFYYSDMYNEEQYPTDKPKWPEPDRHAMLNDMNNKINNMVRTLQKEME